MTSSSAVDNTIETPVGSKPWDEAIADLLSEISDAQAELLAVLSQKRQVIAAGDFESLPQFDERERSLAERLTQCLDGRRALLDAAAAQGLPGGSMKQLAAAVRRDIRALAAVRGRWRREAAVEGGHPQAVVHASPALVRGDGGANERMERRVVLRGLGDLRAFRWVGGRLVALAGRTPDASHARDEDNEHV